MSTLEGAVHATFSKSVVTLPHVDAWNTWYESYGNRPAGFAALNESVTTVAKRLGREPSEIERSACVLVVLDRTAGERSIEDGVVPLEGSMQRIVSPITERSIRDLGETLALLDRV